MTKLDLIIEKFAAIREQLSKAVNESDDTDSNVAKGDMRGVHVSNNDKNPGRSTMGIMARVGEMGGAKAEAKRNLKEMKSLPKPKLAKDEDCMDSMEMAEKETSWCKCDEKEGDNAKCPMHGEKVEKSGGFKRLEHKLEGEGHSKESADNIAAAVGRKKYGAKEFADMAHKSDTMPEVKEVHMDNEKVSGKPYDREVMKLDKNGQWSIDKSES
jgi:hypothetical protein